MHVNLSVTISVREFVGISLSSVLYFYLGCSSYICSFMVCAGYMDVRVGIYLSIVRLRVVAY